MYGAHLHEEPDFSASATTLCWEDVELQTPTQQLVTHIHREAITSYL
jgi:hypothetical protein